MLWERFGDKTIDHQLWYYRALLKYFAQRFPAPLVEVATAVPRPSRRIGQMSRTAALVDEISNELDT